MAIREHIEDIAAKHAAGSTLQEIGDYYGVTRERVRQVLVQEIGAGANDGGAAVRAKARKEAAIARRNQRFMARYGMSYDEYKHVNSAYSPRPSHAFSRQKKDAANRGIEWDMSFAEWWCIWSESGKWEDRGRGRYVMARHSDSGPYRAGNVKIIHANENSSEYIRRYWKEVRSGKRPPPKPPKSRKHRGIYYDMAVGETRTRDLRGMASPRHAQSAALNYAALKGWKFKTQLGSDVLTVTRIS